MLHRLILKPENPPQPVVFTHTNVVCVLLGLHFLLSQVRTSLLPGRTVLVSVDEDHAHGTHSFKNATRKHGNDLSSLFQQALSVTLEKHRSTSISKS